MDSIWQANLEFESVGGPGVRFRWTNSYYWLQDSALLRPQSGVENLFQGIGIGTASAYGTYRGRYVRRYSEPGFTDMLYTPQPGQRPVVGTPLPTACCYLWGMSGTRRVSYHRLRGPDGYEAANDGYWSAAVLSWLQQAVVDRLARMRICNVHGELVQTWVLDGQVRPWVWRHGTERRLRTLVQP